MVGTIPKGTISVYNRSLYRQRNSYKTRSKDYGTYMFVQPPKDLERHFKEAFKRYNNNGNHFLMPCVVEEMVNIARSHHTATLLIPKGIDETSEFFVPGLVVPDLKLTNLIESKGSIRGFVLSSEYLNGQSFYASPSSGIDWSSDQNTKYQGTIHIVYKSENRRPKVKINLSSEKKPGIFEKNEEKLEKIVNTEKIKFWWDLDNQN